MNQCVSCKGYFISGYIKFKPGNAIQVINVFLVIFQRQGPALNQNIINRNMLYAGVPWIITSAKNKSNDFWFGTDGTP